MEELPEYSLLVKVHTVDARSLVYIRPSLAVLFLLLMTSSWKPNSSTNLAVEVAELALVDSIHQPDLASSRSMVKSTLLLRRREVMVVVEEPSRMRTLGSGHGIGRCMDSIPMRKPWLAVGEMDMVGIVVLLDVCLRVPD